AAMILGCPDHLAHAIGGADVAGIDAQACGAGFGRLDRPFVVEVDVGNDRHGHFGHDASESPRRILVGAGDTDDIGARDLRFADLADGPLDIGRQGVGHRLHADRSIAADRDRADPDLPALAALDVSVWAYAHPLLVRLL